MKSFIPPVNTQATPEAQDLLEWLYKVDGRITLSGQHNQMHHMSEVSDRVCELTGKTPLVWGGEWGFSDERHDIDNVKYRPRLLDQIRDQHQAGRIVCLTYHQASPTVGEPCDFIGGVICKVSEDEWDSILNPGTVLHDVWAEHVDRLAVALRILQSEGIPVIFRPYHEMNGDWFWWGGKPERYRKLWRMLYDRFTHEHRLNNVLWAWNTDRPWAGIEDYYPGHEVVDLLGADIYPTQGQEEVYPQEWYERIRGIAEGRPTALSEMSVLPTDEQLETQPWTWFMCWDAMIFRANSEERIRQVYEHPRVVSDRRSHEG